MVCFRLCAANYALIFLYKLFYQFERKRFCQCIEVPADLNVFSIKVLCFRLCAANYALIFLYKLFFISLFLFWYSKCREKKKTLTLSRGDMLYCHPQHKCGCCRDVITMETLKTGCYREVAIIER